MDGRRPRLKNRKRGGAVELAVHRFCSARTTVRREQDGKLGTFAKRRLVGLGLACLVIVLTLTGCVQNPSIVPVPPTATVEFVKPTDIPLPTPKPTPVAPQFPLPAPELKVVGLTARKSCVICHTSEDFLVAAAAEEEVHRSLSEGQPWEGELPTGEPWERVLFDDEPFSQTLHGRYGCTSCHGGQGDSVYKEEAHAGIVRDPAPADACGDCHAKEVTTTEKSVHATLAGFWAALTARSTPANRTQLEVMAGNHCESCHATCGQCHVSRPTHAGGGLVANHQFSGALSMSDTCNGCHGGRVVQEYQGKVAANPGDVHWVEGRMICTECHSADELHGATLVDATHRYAGPPAPGCEKAGCHPNVAPGDGVEQHDDTHLGSMSCQTCHATDYANCYGCHVGQEDGTSYFEMEPVEWTFKIGINPQRNFERPWKWVPLRHVPVTRDSFAYYGQNLLPNFDALPTWKYTTPHTIQRRTPQNETCNACHGNAELFLTPGDVAPDERDANKEVIVRSVPDPIP